MTPTPVVIDVPLKKSSSRPEIAQRLEQREQCEPSKTEIDSRLHDAELRRQEHIEKKAGTAKQFSDKVDDAKYVHEQAQMELTQKREDIDDKLLQAAERKELSDLAIQMKAAEETAKVNEARMRKLNAPLSTSPTPPPVHKRGVESPISPKEDIGL
ncbi:hypothetical protein BLNAU_12226 [Blattamonas nauphoetae]|uniref:Uncharacterized protein n=1 Tax=Blattamonas nauphoetae TaxID=2049346 RepID=A0ABQ9XN40_9EUKA|nr:hypothetical protein BLNAU_12226 [Blattamonas nauphoetae]